MKGSQQIFPKVLRFVFCPGVGGQETSTWNEPGKRILFVCLFRFLSGRKALPDLKLCPAYVLSIENRRIKILSWKQARGNWRFVVCLTVVVKTDWIKILFPEAEFGRRPRLDKTKTAAAELL